MSRTIRLAIPIALVLAPALTLQAQDAQRQQQQQQPQQQDQAQPQERSIQGEQPMDDRLFAMAAAASGMAEIGISQMALQKTEDEQVRSFAERMIADHTQANQKLAQLAQAKGLQMPNGPGLKDTATALALAGSAPEQFPQEYFKQQEAAHMIAIGLFKAQAERGSDEELREFARSALPKLQEHLQMARQHASGSALQGNAGSQQGQGETQDSDTGKPGTEGNP
jgi:putative membrane protein